MLGTKGAEVGKVQLTVRVSAAQAEWMRDNGISAQKVISAAIDRLKGESDPERRLSEICAVLDRLKVEQKEVEAACLRKKAREAELVLMNEAVSAALSVSSELINWPTINQYLALESEKGRHLSPLRTGKELTSLIRNLWTSRAKEIRDESLVCTIVAGGPSL